MAKVPAHPTRVYFDEFDISGFINGTEFKLKQQTIPVACFSDTGPRRLVANHDHDADHMGFFDGATGQFDAQAFIDMNTDEDHYLGQAFGSAAAAAIIHEQIVRLSEQPRSGGEGGAVLLNLKADGSGGVARSTILTTGAFAVDNNGTGRNLGATISGQTFQAVFRVIAYSGLTNVLLKIQESQNDGGADPYADIAGLTNTFTAVGVARKTTTAATEAWKRAVVDVTGTGSATVLVTAGVLQNSA